MYLTRIIGATLLSIVLLSCGSKPTVDDLQETLSAEIYLASDGRFELVSVIKDNAIDREFLGQEIYSIKYTAEIEVKEDCWTYIDKTGFGRYLNNFKTYKTNPGFSGPQALPAKCTKGDFVTFSDEANYVNTENGWKKERI